MAASAARCMAAGAGLSPTPAGPIRPVSTLTAIFPPLSTGVRVLIDDVTAEPHNYSVLSGKNFALHMHKKATACSHMDASFVNTRVDTTNGLLVAAVLAFKGHHPLEITPDAIFSTIMAGVSAHVNADPERFRSSFVAHEGKKELQVRDNSLVMDSWENRWDRPVAELGRLLMDNLSNESARQVLATSFTSTGPAQSAAHTMTFMDVVKGYFEYIVFTDCGIPHVDIAGCKEDWEKLAAAISPLLIELGLEQWNNQLQRILGHFAAAFDSKAEQDQAFWQGILKYNGPAGLGGKANVTGWLSELFPYLNGKVSPAVNIPGGIKAQPYQSLRRRYLANPSEPEPCCIVLSSFPGSTTATPFPWNYHKEQHKLVLKMELVAGIIGVVACDSGALKPEVGWLVCHAQ